MLHVRRTATMNRAHGGKPSLIYLLLKPDAQLMFGGIRCVTLEAKAKVNRHTTQGASTSIRYGLVTEQGRFGIRKANILKAGLPTLKSHPTGFVMFKILKACISGLTERPGCLPAGLVVFGPKAYHHTLHDPCTVGMVSNVGSTATSRYRSKGRRSCQF